MAKSKVEKGVTLIAANTQIDGNVSFEDQLFVSGMLSGSLVGQQPGATLVVSDEGKVCGEIRVPNVVVNGEIEGDVYASERLELGKTAKVKGNVYYKQIEMQLGALVDGQLLHKAFTESGELPEKSVAALVK